MADDFSAHLERLEANREHFEWNYVKDHYVPCRLLDFGCGYGYADIWLARHGFDVVGYDMDEERITVAQELKRHQSEDIRVLFWYNAIPKRDYQLIWLSHVLEHIPISLWPREFDLARRSCAIDGVPMLVSVPLGHAYDMPQHVNHWETAEELVRDLEEQSGLLWRAWEDYESHVIKATFVGDE